MAVQIFPFSISPQSLAFDQRQFSILHNKWLSLIDVTLRFQQTIEKKNITKQNNKSKLQQLFKMLKLRNISSWMFIEVFEVKLNFFLKYFWNYEIEAKKESIFTIFEEFNQKSKIERFGNKKPALWWI